jgi:hypothetical protein
MISKYNNPRLSMEREEISSFLMVKTHMVGILREEKIGGRN